MKNEKNNTLLTAIATITCMMVFAIFLLGLLLYEYLFGVGF